MNPFLVLKYAKPIIPVLVEDLGITLLICADRQTTPEIICSTSFLPVNKPKPSVHGKSRPWSKASDRHVLFSDTVALLTRHNRNVDSSGLERKK